MRVRLAHISSKMGLIGISREKSLVNLPLEGGFLPLLRALDKMKEVSFHQLSYSVPGGQDGEWVDFGRRRRPK